MESAFNHNINHTFENSINGNQLNTLDLSQYSQDNDKIKSQRMNSIHFPYSFQNVMETGQSQYEMNYNVNQDQIQNNPHPSIYKYSPIPFKINSIQPFNLNIPIKETEEKEDKFSSVDPSEQNENY